MPVELIIAPEAKQDLADAYDWYEDRRIGLGEELLSCVEAAFDSIRRAAASYPTVHQDYRRAIVRRFPYAIFFEHENETVTVYCVIHCSQDPQKWKRRLP